MAQSQFLGQIAIEVGYLRPEELELALELQGRFRSAGKSYTIGEILVDRGFLTADQLAEVVAAQQAGGSDSPAVRVGDLIVTNNLATAEQVEECLSEQKRVQEAEGRKVPLATLLLKKGYLDQQQKNALLRLQDRLARKPAAQPEVRLEIGQDVSLRPDDDVDLASLIDEEDDIYAKRARKAPPPAKAPARPAPKIPAPAKQPAPAAKAPAAPKPPAPGAPKPPAAAAPKPAGIAKPPARPAAAAVAPPRVHSPSGPNSGALGSAPAAIRPDARPAGPKLDVQIFDDEKRCLTCGEIMLRAAVRCGQCDAKYCLTCGTHMGRAIEDQCPRCLAQVEQRAMAQKAAEDARARQEWKKKEKGVAVFAAVGAVVVVLVVILLVILL